MESTLQVTLEIAIIVVAQGWFILNDFQDDNFCFIVLYSDLKKKFDI